MHLTWQHKNFQEDIKFILFHQQDDTTDWWRRQLFTAYHSLDYELAKSLSEPKRFQYITEQMKIQAIKRKGIIENSIKTFAEYWYSQIANKINSAYSSAFDNNCANILNTMTANVGLNPICPRNIIKHSFDIYHYFETDTAITTALHEITHFVWFYFWQKHFHDAPTEYDFPQIKWLLSEIVVETIIRNSQINLLTTQPQYIAYQYFYDIQLNQEAIFNTMKKMYINRTNIYDFMEKSFRWIQENELELRNKITIAEK